METNDTPLETITKSNASPGQLLKRGQRPLRSVDSYGEMESVNSSLSESISSKSSKRFTNKRINKASTSIETTDENALRNSYQLDKALTPVTSSQKTSLDVDQFRQNELPTVPDEEEDDDDDEREQRIDAIQVMSNRNTTGVGGSENHVMDIQQFSLLDIDAYLDIYFETLDNRLRHFIGDNEQLQQFRLAMKNRINTDPDAREYQNVLVGRMDNEVVAALTLSFPNESTTVSNDNTLSQENSCLTSIRRWMIRKANYTPNNVEECYIEMIGVKSAWRSHGIGAAMLECAEQFARQAGARLLTIHSNGAQLENYFHRFGFNKDHLDSSAFWKWIVERQSMNKMSKIISPIEENNDYPTDNTGSYINESMVGSVDE